MKKPYAPPQVRSYRAPVQASVRLDAPTRLAIEKYMNDTKVNFSQAVRMLVALALREEEASDMAFRRQAFREGVIKGVAALNERMYEAIESALEETE
jgi:hypothetical protein